MRLTTLSLLILAAPIMAACRADAQAPGRDFRVSRIRFYPAAGHAAEMKGGQFLGSLTGPTNDFETVANIEAPPAEGQWAEIVLPADRVKAYRYLKYQGPNNFAADISEAEFYAGGRKLTGTPFGTTGSGDADNKPERAFDGDAKTAFRGAGTYNQYVGLDLGPASQSAAPRLSAAQGSYRAAVSLSLSTPTPGARILVSIDGWGRPIVNAKGQPENGRWYEGAPIDLQKSAIVQAVAVTPGLADSEVAIAAYRIGAAPADPKAHAEFHIGNSLTDTVNPWMEPLAASAGHKTRYYRFTIPGAPTDWLWDHPGSGFGETHVEQAFLARAPLTDLITQPFAGHGRSIDNEANYSGRFFDLARKSSPQLQMWLYVQWPANDWTRDAWANGHSELQGKRVTFGEPAKTWQEAVANHLRYTEAVMNEMNRVRADEIRKGACKRVLIIPGGLALAMLKTRVDAGTVPGMKDFVAEVFHSPTDIHLTPKGAYLIALVHYACLYRENPEGKVSSAGSELTPEQAKLFQQIAWSAASHYPYSGISAPSAR